MKLVAYLTDGHKVDVRPAPVERTWMSETDQRFAYRCLPLNIANAFGWEILCPSGFVAEWNGGSGKDSIEIHPDAGSAAAPAISHFAHGILTFHVPCLFRTEDGFDLMAQGPINRPKDAIAPLSGVIETDWAPYSFTMNWKFTRSGVAIRFEQGEPFCHIFPVKRGELETINPELRRISERPDLQKAHEEWRRSRAQFNVDLQQDGSQARVEGWQRSYLRSGEPDLPHRTRLRLKDFKNKAED